jgi:hypothetical protein
MLIAGFGFAGIWAPSQNVALYGVSPSDAGAAAAASNTANQLGGSIGLAILTNVFLMAAAGQTGLAAQAAGNSAALAGSGVTLLVAAVVAATMLKIPKDLVTAMMGRR